MLSDATQIDRLQTELNDLNRRIDAQSSKLSSGLYTDSWRNICVAKNQYWLMISIGQLSVMFVLLYW